MAEPPSKSHVPPHAPVAVHQLIHLQFRRPTAAKKQKPKSETYKWAWSFSEQHFLERLLSENPDGEKNRYEKTVLVLGPRVRLYSKCYSQHTLTPRQIPKSRTKVYGKIETFWCYHRVGVTFVTYYRSTVIAYVRRNAPWSVTHVVVRI